MNELQNLREAAHGFLLEADRPVETHVIARHLFGPQRHEMPEAHVVVRTLLNEDPRFVKTHDQRWCARGAPHLLRPLSEVKFAVVDLETTGSVIGVDEIIDLGLVPVRRGSLGEPLGTRIRTERAIPPWVSRLTGIRNEDLVSAATLDSVAGELLAHIEGSVFTAHDIRFDLPFLRWEIMRRDLAFPPVPALCTLQLSRALWPDLPSHSLPELAAQLDVGHAHPHRAVEDALATAGVLQRMLAELQRLGRTTLGDLYDLVAPASALDASASRRARSAQN